MLEEFTVNALPTDSTLVCSATLLVVSEYWNVNLEITTDHVKGKENFQFSCIQLHQKVQRINFWD